MKRLAFVFSCGIVVAASFAVVPAAGEPPAIAAKRAEVERVLAEIEELDASLGHAVEAYNLATEQLAEIETEQEVNRRHLAIAKRNLRIERAALARRLVAMYKTEETSAVGVLLGSATMEDLLTRVDAANRVARQDARVLREVRQFRATVERHKAKLARAHASQEQVVAERNARKSEIAGALAERESLVASIRDEIARLEEEERQRQLELERQARERLLEQQRTARLAALNEAAAPYEPEDASSSTSEAAAPDADEDSGAIEEDAALSEEETVGVAAETPEATVAPPSQYGGVVGIAMQYLGVPYVWGGASPSGFDCSGFTLYVYAQVGVSLPHYTGSQWQMGVPVSRDDLQPGDLVFFNGLGHMGIYIGGGQMIHAPHTGDVVKISDINSGWYASTYDGARRIL